MWVHCARRLGGGRLKRASRYAYMPELHDSPNHYYIKHNAFHWMDVPCSLCKQSKIKGAARPDKRV